jgi:hypothetical protein
MELMKKRKGDEKTYTETWTASKKLREMNAWWEYISHEIEDSKQLDADFKFPKFLLISLRATQIRRDGASQ